MWYHESGITACCMKPFIHLHLHSEYSLLDSTLRIKDLVRKAGEYNMPAAALTDHGSMLGAIHFHDEAMKGGIKPIIGSELYVAMGSRLEKPERGEDRTNYHHLVALVKNDQGYKNLCELITRSYIEGFYRKPRVDKELLEKYGDGLIIMSACIQGEIPYLLLRDHDDQAEAAARWYQNRFRDDFFLEIQDHGLPQQREVLPKLVELAHRLSIPLVASNDVHYTNLGDADARDILICLQTREVLANDERAMKKETEEMYFKSTAEMERLFPAYPESLAVTMDIAARCQFSFRLGKYFLPEFKVPVGTTIDDYFEKICLDGFARLQQEYLAKGKKLKHPIPQYEERLRYEIEKIREMGFPGYFLIVWDILRHAREIGIPVGPGRGSVVGSLVAFAMSITQIDPLEYDLIFERFLNPSRVSMPDIDMDFDGERRDEVISYIRQRYGEENVAQIITFGKMKARLAVRDIGRVMGIALPNVDRLAKMIPEGPGVTLTQVLKDNKDLEKEIRGNPETGKLFDFALKLESNVRHTSMHAAGVVIAPRKLTEFMPLYKTRDDITTHFEKEEVEHLGLLKMDILGLKTLTIIRNILSELRAVEGKEIDLDNIPLTDARTFKVFQKGDTDGIFQFESSGMRDMLKKVKPTRIEDLIVLNGLYRPGPLQAGMVDTYINRKIGREEVEYIIPEVEDVLKDTCGIIVFQEQVMRILVKVAGFTMSGADEIRKIMGKKQMDKMPAQHKKFMEMATARGFDKKKLDVLWSQMETFAGYGFNKSHSAAYAYLAYQTAYLKAHFPVYFMAAHLSSESEKTSTSSKIIQYISESKKMGFDILPPDINRSHENFRVESPTSIRFGLVGLKGAGASAVASIMAARDAGGPFASYSDFLRRIDLTKVNKTVVEGLTKAGALDGFGIRRKVLFESLPDCLRQAQSLAKRGETPQRSLFADAALSEVVIAPEFAALEEWSEAELIQGEKEIGGVYITRSPVEKFAAEITKVSNTSIGAILAKEFTGEQIKLGGAVTSFSERKSRKGAPYGELFFEDLTGRIKVLAFKDRWIKVREELKVDTPYFLEGKNSEGEEATIYLESLVELESFLKKKARKILIHLRYDQITPAFNEKLQGKLERNRDSVPYMVEVVRPDGYRVILNAEENQGLKATTAMKRDIEKLTGENSVEILF